MADIQTPLQRSPNQLTYIDQADPSNIYIGIAKIGSSGSAGIWQIRKISNVSNVLLIQFAGGVSTFTNIWNNRASYSYS
jgi:hypothetical protein